MVDQLHDRLRDRLRPEVERTGLSWWGMELHLARRRALLRIYIEHPERPVTLDDCERVSHALAEPLEGFDGLPERYDLEVSSPGLDRRLFEPDQFRRSVGAELQVSTFLPVHGRKRFRGLLCSATEERFVLRVDGREYEIEYRAVQQARRVPRF